MRRALGVQDSLWRSCELAADVSQRGGADACRLGEGLTRLKITLGRWERALGLGKGALGTTASRVAVGLLGCFWIFGSNNPWSSLLFGFLAVRVP